MKKLSDVIVYDIFSPPQASRIYAYPSIAAYEVLRHKDGQYKFMAGQLNGLNSIPVPEADETYSYSLASIIAFLKVGKALIFSEEKIELFQNEILQEFKDFRMPGDVYERSLAYGNEVADHILAWADEDNYKQTRSFPKYTVTDDPARWKPTPPGYMDGIEPAWNKIRTFVIDSAQQFQPPFPTDYNMEEGSAFYEEAMEVYTVVNDAGEEEKEIASFWDCNPYVLNVTGHIMHATKKITPGGHWIGITAIACRNAEADMLETSRAYMMTSIALADAFISCWDEKYRSNLTRPETVINEHIDEKWLPILQTPPFPEYTSGHSVISSSAAIVLTDIFGDNFEFTDDVEVEFGLPARKFKSFIHASEEAAISRLYGGIHYRPAIDNGVTQGRKLGSFILNNITTKEPS
ncbi:MAG: vanadium-dependent haloperoxidase [Saprospiraceae bacterium]|nr:vanadium-dependent haloperoxidase [Saprospiraceae bacterium]